MQWELFFPGLQKNDFQLPEQSEMLMVKRTG